MNSLDLWFREPHKDQMALSIRVKNRLWSGNSTYQSLDILETELFGRILLLDGVIMTSERDEFIYHEMIAHVPMCNHHQPRRVLVIGGGDGGTVREVVKHPGVEHVDLVEIDALVVEKCREYLPDIACALSDPRVQIHHEDGIRWVRDRPAHYDVIVVDSTDPAGLAEGLFSAAFYQDCARSLTARGLLTAQTGSPFFDHAEVLEAFTNLRAAFSEVVPYTACIPTYPGGYWCFAFASKTARSRTEALPGRYEVLPGLRYYSPEVHRAAFVLPKFFRDLLQP